MKSNLTTSIASVAAAICAIPEQKPDKLEIALRKIISDFKANNPGKECSIRVEPIGEATAEDASSALRGTNRAQTSVSDCEMTFLKDGKELRFKLTAVEGHLPENIRPLPLASELLLKLKAENYLPSLTHEAWIEKPRRKEWEPQYPYKQGKKARRKLR